MKLIVFAAVLATVAASAPQYQPSYSPPSPAPYTPTTQKYGQQVPQILSQQFDLRPDGSYDSSYQTENGISASDSGRPVADYGGQPSYAREGQYSYTDDYGNTYTVTYTAGVNGYQPQGAHLPVPVPTEYPIPQVPVVPQGDYQPAPAPKPVQPQYQPY
ncbi:Pupal cuticle protein 27 [Amphibalanus amphitrite]|uniref:Pupal cuticle protein 27 n=1 Tax=Amphibalanus amphitrite TaxID=1232801 RepID=A0A6A4WEG9_AMPAM|nr:Pupal cuticle protein 27 [Amphibalanus amphitrite]